MTENYMDYSPDSCMNVFTKNQAERMMAVIEKSPRRNNLVKYWCTQLPFGNQFAIEIAPNPTNGEAKIKVTLKEVSTFTVELFSLSGQLIQQKLFENYPSWEVPLSTVDTPSGTYLVRVKTKDETVTQRLVVVR